MEQHQTDTTRIVDVITVVEPCQTLYWDDLTGEALGAQDVRKARNLGVEYFKQMGVYQKAPM